MLLSLLKMLPGIRAHLFSRTTCTSERRWKRKGARYCNHQYPCTTMILMKGLLLLGVGSRIPPGREPDKQEAVSTTWSGADRWDRMDLWGLRNLGCRVWNNHDMNLWQFAHYIMNLWQFARYIMNLDFARYIMNLDFARYTEIRRTEIRRTYLKSWYYFIGRVNVHPFCRAVQHIPL
jgi:hypothetical protein